MDQKKFSKEEKARSNERFLKLAEGKNSPPTCYAYDRQIEAKDAERVKKISGTLFGYTPVNRPQIARNLGMQSWVGDPVSDQALLAMEDQDKSPLDVIDVFLEKGIDGFDNPPEAFTALWQQISTEPEWLDWELLEHGAKVYRRYGVTGFQFQGISSIDGYRLESLSKTLMSTGQYANDTAFKRFLLTCNFWTEISEKDGMKLFAEGWKTALRVRLLHTLIRRSVVNNPKWDTDKLGMPINQIGLLGAPLISSVLLGYLLKYIGYRPTDRDIDGLMHLWRYVAHTMGLQDGMFPETKEEGLQMVFDLYHLEEMTDLPEGIELGSSFLKCFEPSKDLKGKERLARWIEHKTNIAQTLFFVSPGTRKAINAPNPTFWATVYWILSFPKNSLVDTLRHRFPAFSDSYDRRVTKTRREWLSRQISEADLVYRPQPKY